jgi:hypothetical protein
MLHQVQALWVEAVDGCVHDRPPWRCGRWPAGEPFGYARMRGVGQRFCCGGLAGEKV